MNFNEYLVYDETSPSCLRWVKEIKSGRGRKMTQAGMVAGSISKDGYYRVSLFGKKYQCHRIILALNFIDATNKQVDHIDRCKTNNKIENLRVVSIKENSKNRLKSKNNTSGFTGVCLTKSGCKSFYFDENGKIKTKTFNVKNFKNKEEMLNAAVSWRKENLKILQYSNFHGE